MRDMVQNKFWMKLAAMVLATLIWLTVQATLEKEKGLTYRNQQSADEMERQAATQRRFDLPVHVRCNGTNHPALRTSPARVSVIVSGDPARLTKVEAWEFKVFVEAGDQPNVRELLPVQVITPPNVNWLRVLPIAVRLHSVPRMEPAPRSP